MDKSERAALPPLLELTRARTLEFLREPAALFWTFGFPVLIAIALGLAFRAETGSQERLRVAVASESAQAAWTAGALQTAPELLPRRMPRTAADDALRRGEIDLIVEAAGPFDPGASDPASRPVFLLRYDPTRPQSLAVRLRVTEAIQRALGRQDRAEMRQEELTLPGSRYIDFLIPGLIGTNLMITGLWGVGFVAVRARATRLLKRFAATGMRRADYLLALVLARLLFLLLEVGALLAVGLLIFGMQVRGSWLDLILVLVLGALSFTALAVLIAARTTSLEGVSALINLVIIPAGLLSGTFFSYTRFPEVVQVLVRALPLTALNDALRTVINDGGPLAATWPELTVMTAWMAGGFLLGLRLFRWQ